MTNEELKNKKGEYLQEVIRRCLENEPKLTYAELAFLILEFLEADKLIKAIKKEIKNKF